MEPIVLSSDEDDQDLDRPTKYRRTEGPQRLPTSGGAATESSGASSVLGLDRKQMELERLARLAKRNAAASEPATTERRLGPHPGPTTATATGSESVPYHVKERPEVKQSAAKQSAATSDAEPKSAAPGAGTAQANAPYPRGCVRRTWSFGTPRGNDIKIEEVFQKNQLELAVLSSFQWDEEWLMSKLDMSRTKLILIAFAASEAEVWRQSRHQIQASGIPSRALTLEMVGRERPCGPMCRGRRSASAFRP